MKVIYIFEKEGLKKVFSGFFIKDVDDKICIVHFDHLDLELYVDKSRIIFL